MHPNAAPSLATRGGVTRLTWCCECQCFTRHEVCPARDIDIEAVTKESAAAWLLGEFAVGNSLLECENLDFSRPEVIFLNVLGNRQSYRFSVARTLELAASGATCAVAHACGPVMLARYRRQGGIVCLTEQIKWRGQSLEARRLFIPPPAFAAWLAKIRA